MDDKLSLFQHNATLFTDMEEEERSYELETWKAMNLARGLAVILGWLLVALRPNTDLLYKNLRSIRSKKKHCAKVDHTESSQTESHSTCRKLEGGGGRKKEMIETIKMP